jgi:dipeptidase D
MEEKVLLCARNAGANANTMESYPGWDPDLYSRLLALSGNAYSRITGKVPEVKAVHAGLECGIIGRHYPTMQMVSIGPTMTGVHSPDEKVEVKSVEIFWKVLIELLDSI